MANPWFRMYSDFIYDEKIEFLAFEDQRHYVFLLCMKNIGLLDKDYPQTGMLERVISKRLGLVGEAFDAMKSRLMNVGLIDANWQPLGWDSRQMVSDSSRERVAAYRARQKNANVTECNVTGNVTETAQDTDTDTDKETDIKTKREKSALSSSPGFVVPDWINETHWNLWLKTRKGKKFNAEQLVMQIQKLEGWKNRGLDYAQALADAAANGWQGLHEPERRTSNQRHNNVQDARLEVANFIFGKEKNGNQNAIIDVTPTGTVASGSKAVPAIGNGVR